MMFQKINPTFRLSRRFVSTGLSSTFNKIHLSANLKRESYFKRTGLFGIDELQGPEGFHQLRDNALRSAHELVREMVLLPEKSKRVLPLFDELSNTLCKVADLAEFVRNGHTQPRFRSIAEQTSIAISSLVEKLNTEQALYNVLRNAAPNDELDERVIKLFMIDFEQSGIHLSKEKREQVLNLNETILKLGSIFSANANQGRLVSKSQIPQSLQHHFNFTGNKTYVNNLFADSENEKLREIGYKLYLSYDETQDAILSELLRCRQELAQLCGFESYAHRAVKGSIAGHPNVVNNFLDILNDRLKSLASKDYDQMLQMKLKNNPTTKTLNAWDVPFYSNLYKTSIYNESVLQCLPYFSIGACMDGLNMIFNELYGVTMQVDNCTSGELWHNDVIKLSIVDHETNSVIGYIYCDLFERPMKQHQDCHHTVRGGCMLRDGSYQKPIVVLVLSLPDSNDDNPSLLSPMMVDNLFHEMGHAMHSMMARTRYQHITGTRCSTDLAEVPSILMEFFASDPRIVSRFARHHATGQAMPNELIKYWIKSKKIFAASETQLQVFYAALDQAYHNKQPAATISTTPSTTDILAKTQAQYYSIPYVQSTAWQLRFAHLVGYGAKYYSYLVSRAVAAAIWRKLFANNPLSRAAGLRYRDEVLAHGGGKPARAIAEDVLNRAIDADFIARSVVESFSQSASKETPSLD